MSFTQVDAAAIAAWTALVFWQPEIGSDPASEYSRANRKVCSPPAWAYWIIWTVLFAMLDVSIIFFTKYAPPSGWQLLSGTVVFVIHLFASKGWMVAFWKWRRPGIALLLLVVVMIPTIAYFTVICCVGAIAFFYVPVILCCIYIVWLVYAMILNVYYMQEFRAVRN